MRSQVPYLSLLIHHSFPKLEMMMMMMMMMMMNADEQRN